MIILRKEQIKALGKIPRISFENNLISFFSGNYPDECEIIGREGVRKIIQYGIERAAFHEYTTQKQVTYYIGLMFILGSDFDQDVQLPWIQEQINDKSIAEPTKRIERCFTSTIQYLENIGGENNGALVKAILRSQKFDIESVNSLTEEEFIPESINLLTQLYPQKSEFQGEQVLNDMVKQGVNDAATYDVLSNKGKFTFLLCMFFFGSFFYRDLQYPWAQKVLNDNTITDENQKADLLYNELFNYSKIGLAKN